MKIVAEYTRLCRKETDADRLGGLLADRALSLDLVSALAGDRLLIDAERLFLDELRTTRGDRLYSDLLHAINHEYFSPETARGLRANILRHKYEMSVALGRNIRIAVASMTVSIGVASPGADASTAQGLVRGADALLYQSKAEGKNRVTVGV